MENNVFEVLLIKPGKNKPNIKQAIIRLSDDVRYPVKDTGDRLFCGMASCKVYDQLYIKRCNRCLDSGHWTLSSKKWKNVNL